jgi:S-phase kinase-associated protein 1
MADMDLELGDEADDRDHIFTSEKVNEKFTYDPLVPPEEPYLEHGRIASLHPESNINLSNVAKSFVLSDEESAKNSELYGRNELKPPTPIPEWKRFVLKFKNTFLALLSICAVLLFVAFILDGNMTYLYLAIVLIAVVLLTAFLQCHKEGNASKIVESFPKTLASNCTVLRGGEEEIIATDQLVPGDIVKIRNEDRVIVVSLKEKGTKRLYLQRFDSVTLHRQRYHHSCSMPIARSVACPLSQPPAAAGSSYWLVPPSLPAIVDAENKEGIVNLVSSREKGRKRLCPQRSDSVNTEPPPSMIRYQCHYRTYSPLYCKRTHPHTLVLPPTHAQVSKEGDQFPVKAEVARMSDLVKSIIDEDDFEEGSEIPLLNVTANVLEKVIEFCEHHSLEPMTEIEKPLKSQNMADVVQQWYADYVNVEQGLLFELILAANYMDIKPLLDLTCATVASMIKGKTPEEIRTTFNIVNDLSPEEEAQVREENRWIDEA